MKVLLTGCTGYIGKRLLQKLSESGHEVTCFVRNMERLIVPDSSNAVVKGYEIDLLKSIPEHLTSLDIDVAFYLVHSMSSSIGQFMEEEALSAQYFAGFIGKTNC
ncbi:MAG TPA: NAD(P)H-binding protein, partial [Prolixibacteraceae bacterium]|nr:NAD(P)H-binding protein [Prolixibacteraceae bacterium]